jgi:hypothetical protein
MSEQQEINEQERYKYIGFETFGGKARPFWKSDADRKKQIENLKSQLGSVFRKSVVYSEVISLTDRVFITIASLVMIAAPFLVWFKADTLYGPVSFTGLTGIANLDGFWFYVQLMGGSVIPATVYLTAALAYLSLLFGVLTLVFLYLPAATKEAYVGRMKMILRIQLIPFLIFLAIVVLGLVSQKIPFGRFLGVEDLGGRYTIVTFIQFSSIGFWLAIFGFILNFNKSKEL